MTKGNVCSFSFYVTALDTKKHFESYGKTANGLSLEQAKSEFAKRCSENPVTVNTMLGVEYETDRKDLEPRGKGAADLLICSNGFLKLSEDYKQSKVLQNEKLISMNAISVLKREASRLQRISDNETAKCAKLISDNAQDVCYDPHKAEEFMRKLADDYGMTRCKDIIANELLGGYGIADEQVMDYLSDSFSGKYNEKSAVFASAEQLEQLARAAMSVESSLTESENKLNNAGLVHGSYENIRDTSAAVKAEIEHHNELEDNELVPDDQMSL